MRPDIIHTEDIILFERKQMEKARGWFLSNLYAYTPEEIEHGKGKEWITEELTRNMQ